METEVGGCKNECNEPPQPTALFPPTPLVTPLVSHDASIQTRLMKSQRLSHEIDGVRKEKERLTASYTPRRFTLFTFVPDVTQGSYGKDSSAGRLTLHHCICRSR